MAVPGSGALSLAGIRAHLGGGAYNTTSTVQSSLEDCSDGTVATINTNNASADRPDGSDPHAMSEFYAYDHDASSGGSWASYTLVYKSGKYSDCSGVCG